MASGTKADQVGFQSDYSKNELRKCIKGYLGKEVWKFYLATHTVYFIVLSGEERFGKTLLQSRERYL